MNRINKFSPPGKTIEYKNKKFHYYAEGSGRPLIFISGSGDPCHFITYQPIWKTLKKTFRVIIFDRSGYGWSEDSLESRDIDIMADEIKTVLDTGGEIGPYSIISHSYGALEALRFMQNYPALTDKLFIIDGGVPPYYLNMWSEKRINKNLKMYPVLRWIKKKNLIKDFMLKQIIKPLKLNKYYEDIFFNMFRENFANFSNDAEGRYLLENAIKINYETELSDTKLFYFTAGKNRIKKMRYYQNEYFKTNFINPTEIFIKSANHLLHWTYSKEVTDTVISSYK